MTPLYFYWGLLAAIAIQRLFEVAKAERNKKLLLDRGGMEVGEAHYTWMVLLHAAWLTACFIESWWREIPPPIFVSIAGLIILAIGQTLRILAIAALDERWTTRIIVCEGVQPVTSGIYNKMRHPNYLGVILEIAALPMIFGNWLTLVVFFILNALLLQVRIHAEEEALQNVSDYQKDFGHLNRFLPK